MPRRVLASSLFCKCSVTSRPLAAISDEASSAVLLMAMAEDLRRRRRLLRPAVAHPAILALGHGLADARGDSVGQRLVGLVAGRGDIGVAATREA